MSFIADLAQIVVIDLTMAGENALAVGLAVAALPKQQRARATAVGIAAATFLRIVLAFFAVQLLHVTGLLAAGGLLLLWVCWKMAHELRHMNKPASVSEASDAPKKFSAAVWQIVVADISMSLDNVLGVAGVARDHLPALIFGLVLSVGLMGFASSQIARLTSRYPKLGYLGVVIVLYTALSMIYDGAQDVLALPSVIAALA